MKRYLTLFALLWSTIILMAETWTNVGIGTWHDNIVDVYHIDDKYPVKDARWNVKIEQSDVRPNVFRVQPYANASNTLGAATASSVYKDDDSYVYIHITARNRVYIENFHITYYGANSETSALYHLDVKQRCPENGFDSKFYGYVTTDECVVIGAKCLEIKQQKYSTDVGVPHYNTTYSQIMFPKGVITNNIYDKSPQEYYNCWTPRGSVMWCEGIVGANAIDATNYPITPDKKRWSVQYEKSDLRPNTFRMKPYTLASQTLGYAKNEIFFTNYGWYREYIPYNDDTTYVKVHVLARDRVYIEPFSWSYYGNNNATSSRYYLSVKQRCPENGYSDKYYGVVNSDNKTIEFPIGAFETEGYLSGGSRYTTDKHVIIFPANALNDEVFNFVEPNPTDDNGIYMGIVSFNTKLKILAMQRLFNGSKKTFFDFINSMQMDNATLLYYTVEKCIELLGASNYPQSLNNAILITFTDGLDQGSLAMNPAPKNWRNYATQLHTQINKTKIQGLPLKAYTIGLKSADVLDDEQFMFNLTQLASDDSKAHPVTNIAEVENELTKIYEELNSRTTKRTISITVPMMSDGDKYRLTLDGTDASSSAKDSKRWIQGTFNIDDYSLNNITYYGVSSASGTKIKGKLNGLYLTFTFDDCRDETGNILDIKDEDIDEWIYIPSRDDWQHNVEMMREGVIKVEDIKTSAAIMFALDASKSLGDQFPALKTTAINFIKRLLGEYNAVEDIRVEAVEEPQDWSDAEVYNLQGVRVTNPTSGFYILRKGNYTKKILLR